MKKCLLLHTVDKEDYWISGISFIIPDSTKSFEDAYIWIVSHLYSEEFINLLIQKYSLLEDSFHNDNSFNLKSVEWKYGVVFNFENSNKNMVSFKLLTEFITLFENVDY